MKYSWNMITLIAFDLLIILTKFIYLLFIFIHDVVGFVQYSVHHHPSAYSISIFLSVITNLLHFDDLFGNADICWF